MPAPRVRFGSSPFHQAGLRLAHELVAARAVAGLTQTQMAVRAGVSQALISQAERGRTVPGLDVMHRLAAATGHDLVVRLYPADGVRLRDSGQLQVAETIRAMAAPAWRVQLEVPVGAAPDRRAVDMLLESPTGAIAVEIERALLDLQAQMRAAQLKRAAMAERTGRSLRLVIAVPDTRRNRAAVLEHRSLLAAALPVRSKSIWACLRSGSQPDGDGLVWVRVPAATARKNARKAYAKSTPISVATNRAPMAAHR